MMVYGKQSQIENNIDEDIFSVITVSANKDLYGSSFAELLPNATDMIALSNGDISKKKFKKNYEKYLSKDIAAQEDIYYICKAITKAKKPFVVTCTDEEWKIGYIQILVKYLEDKLDISIPTYKDALKLIKEEMKEVPKKSRKMIKLSFEELTQKGVKIKKGFLRIIRKRLEIDVPTKGMKFIDKLDEMFAIKSVCNALVNDEVVVVNKDSTISINPDNLNKKGKETIVNSILANANAGKKFKKIITNELEKNDLKLNEKKLKKLDKSQLVTIVYKLSGAVLNIDEDTKKEDK